MVRSSMHQAGALALTQLLQYDPPEEQHRTVPCTCGHLARYKELRDKTILTVVGQVRNSRPCHLCSHRSEGQHPVDAELGIENLESSPGVTTARLPAPSNSFCPLFPGRIFRSSMY